MKCSFYITAEYNATPKPPKGGFNSQAPNEFKLPLGGLGVSKTFSVETISP